MTRSARGRRKAVFSAVGIGGAEGDGLTPNPDARARHPLPHGR